MAPNKKISKETYDLLINFKSELVGALTKDGISIDDINNYNSRDQLTLPGIKPKPRPQTPTCDCYYTPYDDIGQEDLGNIPDGTCSVYRECWYEADEHGQSVYAEDYISNCYRRPDGSCGCRCKYDGTIAPPTCCDIRDKQACDRCPDCWWDEVSAAQMEPACFSLGHHNSQDLNCGFTTCVNDGLSNNEWPDTNEEEEQTLTTCEPDIWNPNDPNDVCVAANSDYPYCTGDGICVECLNTGHCEDGDECEDFSCVSPFEPVTQCLNPGAVNYELSPDSYLGECIETEEQCLNYLSEAYATSTPYTGALLVDGCCCFTLDGWSYETLPGDMNGDGILNVLDIVLMVGQITQPGGPDQYSENYLPPYMGGDVDFQCPDCPDYEECPDCDDCSNSDCYDDGYSVGFDEGYSQGQTDYTCSDGECPDSGFVDSDGDTYDDTSYNAGYSQGQTDYTCSDGECGDSCEYTCVNQTLYQTDCSVDWTCCNTNDGGLFCNNVENDCLGGCFLTADDNPYGLGTDPCNSTNCPANTTCVDDGSCTWVEGPCDGFMCSPGLGPFNCDQSECLGNLDPDVYVDADGFDCADNCGKSDAGKIFILDCNGDCFDKTTWDAYVVNDTDACYDGGVNPDFACESKTQLNGEEFYFSCSLGNCLDQCGVCEGNNDCADCADNVGGSSDYDDYPLSETTVLTIVDGEGGCCHPDQRIKYYKDTDFDGLGEFTESTESLGDYNGYTLCPTNPNLSDHCYSPTDDINCGSFSDQVTCEGGGCTWGTPFVSNYLDDCVDGTIDICGKCTSDADYDSIDVCGGCLDSTACNYDDTMVWDDGTCCYGGPGDGTCDSQFCDCAGTTPVEHYNCDGICIAGEDCEGTCGGDVTLDCCNVCGGSNYWSGTGCGCIGPECGNDGNPNWCIDCLGVADGDAVEDVNGLCCDITGGSSLDSCGVCDGDDCSCVSCPCPDYCSGQTAYSGGSSTCTSGECSDCSYSTTDCANDGCEGDYCLDDPCVGDDAPDPTCASIGESCFNGVCVCVSGVRDCLGVCDGDAFDNGCGCNVDQNPTDGCDNVCGSTAEIDDCGMCIQPDGATPPNQTVEWNATCDSCDDGGFNCGTMVSAGNYSQCYTGTGCTGNGETDVCLNLVEDQCGVCNGDNSTCLDECGVPNGDNSSCEDECGVPNGSGPEPCQDCDGNYVSGNDCAGVCNGSGLTDDCGVCIEDGTTGYNESCTGCMYPSADNYDAMATVDCGDCCIFGLRAEADLVEILGDVLIPSSPAQRQTYWHAYYYPYVTSISILDVYNNIWLQNPNEVCEAQGLDWENCVMDSVPTLSAKFGDEFRAYSRNGMLKSATYSFLGGGTWQFGTNDGEGLGNIDDSACTPAETGTCVQKGFVGRIGLNVDYQCTLGNCGGECPSQAVGGSYTCDCGVREEMLNCEGVIGWLKFKEPVPPGDVE